MTAVINLTAEKREKTGKGPARQLRREGKIPGIIYGLDKAPVMVALDRVLLDRHTKKASFMSSLVDLKIGNETIRTLPKEVQLHPVSDLPEHADFLQVTDSTRVKVNVKVLFLNPEKSPGIKRGGTLNTIRRHLELYCQASNIPAKIEIDLAGTEIGDSIHIKQVKLPEGVTPTIERNYTIATIVGRQEEKEEAKTAAVEGAAGADSVAGAAAGAAAPAAGDAKAAAAKGGDKK